MDQRIYKMLGRIETLFNRRPGGWGSRDAISVIEPLIQPLVTGRIKVRCIHLPLPACRTGRRNAHSTCSETRAHAQMKTAAIAWMRSEGARDAREEQDCAVGRADAFSEKAGWVVECGHTAKGKLVSAIECPALSRFTLIPFQDQTWANGAARRLVAADFTWDADLQGEVASAVRAKTRSVLATMPNWAVKRTTALAPSLSGRTV